MLSLVGHNIKQLLIIMLGVVFPCVSGYGEVVNFNQWQPVVVADANKTRLDSQITGKQYWIYVNLPSQSVPKSGYPVIYLLDGHVSFFLAKQAIDSLTVRGIMPPLVVVGIDIADNDRKQWLADRIEDYTPSRYSDAALKNKLEKSGGADNFLRVINEEIKPLIEAKFPINTKQQGLYGHSLGGLFVLHTLFTASNSFQFYYAASPSIWWDNQFVLQEKNKFIKGVASVVDPLAVVISVGSAEQEGKGQEPLRKELIYKRRMVDNARELAEQLQELPANKLKLSFKLFQGEDHGLVQNASISHLLNYFSSKHLKLDQLTNKETNK